MMGYVGQARGAKLIAELVREGLGEACQFTEFPPRRHPYFLDNLAFALWLKGQPFNEAGFLRVVERVSSEGPTPDFIVAPDRVADPSSLEWSLSWVPKLRGAAPLAFVVQDGMQDEDVRRALRVGEFRVLFIGGSLEWKLANVPRWVALGHAAGVQVHVGRMGTCRRARYARECGADSVDSCTPLWSKDHLRRFLEGLRGAPTRQPDLFGPRSPPAVARAWKKAV